MCLNSSYGKSSGKRTGYKILVVTEDGFFTGMYGVGRVELNNTELTEDPRERTRVIEYGDLESGGYTPGFHIFAKLSDARKVLRHEKGAVYAIFKVAFRDEVAFGVNKWNWYTPSIKDTKLSTDIIVARECKLLGRISSK